MREDQDRRSRPTASTARYYCQAINATAPHPWAARLWQEFLYSDQGQLLWLKGLLAPGAVHRHGQAQGRAEGALTALPSAAAYAKVQLREPRPEAKARSADQGAVAHEGRLVAR